MNKKVILGLLLVFLMIIPSSCAFDDSTKVTLPHINIKNIETGWTNYSNGYYGYNFDFKIYNLTSAHEIQSVISFYDSDGKVIKNDNLSRGIDGAISQGKVKDNLTITLKDYQKSPLTNPTILKGGISNFNHYEVDHIKIDIIDASENKLLYTLNQTFNMSNLCKYEAMDNDFKTSKSNSDYEFFKDADLNEDGLIDFEEFSEIIYIFTEDSYWDSYSTEEILQSEWDNCNSNGDNYLSFEEFKNVI